MLAKLSVKGRFPRSIIDRARDHIIVNLYGCWLWQGQRDKYGYGIIRVGSVVNNTRKKKGAHRAVYEEIMGKVADNLVLDHLCRTPACVNPGHLEPVTTAENFRRGIQNGGADKRKRRHCVRGHGFSIANTRIRKNGTRQCRMCDALYHR